MSGHRLGRFDGDAEKITDFLSQANYMIISVPCNQYENSKGIHFRYKLIYLSADFLKPDSSQSWEINKKDWRTTNDKGVSMKISHSMSWQIWWTIPLGSINANSFSRELDIL